MSSLNSTDKLKFEKLFDMKSGYVLDFSNDSFLRFFINSIGVNIYDKNYEVYGDSKAKRLRFFWDNAPDNLTGTLLVDMLNYYQTITLLGNDKNITFNERLYKECLKIANKLNGNNRSINKEPDNEKKFLEIEIDEISIDSLGLETKLSKILENRLIELKLCLKYNIPYSAIFLSGSTLEGLFFSVANKIPEQFNRSELSPKYNETGKIKNFHSWKLSNYIDVAHEIGILGLDVKKHSHSLRDFRNYIHPSEQLRSGFYPDIQTARISWQVLKAAMHDIYNFFNKK